MEHYLQTVALVLIAAILGLLVSGQQKYFALLLSLAACSAVTFALVGYLEPVLELVKRIRDLAGISGQTLSVVLKTVGISLTAQLADLVCREAGQNSLGKMVNLMANAAILWISIPLVEELLDLIQEVLGKC